MDSQPPTADRAFALPVVTRAVVISQLLFSAGNVLTTGGFLYYYANAFGPSAFQFSLLLILPELAETAGLFARPVAARVGSRKRTWLACLLMGRMFALGVPLMSLPVITTGVEWPFESIIGWVAFWYVLQGIAYACFISWLTDLAPQTNWGRLFARRKLAMLAIMIVVPVVAGQLRSRWANTLPENEKLVTYVSIFLIGNGLVMASVLPLLKLPDVTSDSPELISRSAWQAFRDSFVDPSLRWMLLHGWWLSFAQGLTQSALFRYQVNVLHIPVETYYALNGLMLLIQMPLTTLAGRLSDRGFDKPTLFWGVTAVSGAMLFWLIATPDRWWLLAGAYVVWGLFGFVNICGRNLLLKLSPLSDNTMQVALFRQVGGLFAAFAGLLGGIWLDRMTGSNTSLVLAGFVLSPFQIIFLTSFLGRLTAGLWVLPIRRPRGAADPG
ncbi:MAG: MFS transporter [Planctomycetaceae bacterium]|nr:MFS transporter [Planctomycetaceae bacterium]